MKCSPVIIGGLYLGGNSDIRPKTINRGMHIGGIQQYRSLADGSQYPGYQKQWVDDLVQSGMMLNMVVELKYYGAATGAQVFTVEGKTYTVSAPVGTIQRRAGTKFPVAYSYQQVLNGQIDGLLHRLLVQVRNGVGIGNINLQLASEVDTDNEFGTSHGAIVYNREDSDQLAEAAYSYVAEWLRNPPSGIVGISRSVTLSLGYAGQWSGIAGFLRIHTERLMYSMDYLHMNSYNHSANWTAEQRLWEIVEYQQNLGPIGLSKNIIVSEIGSNANWPGGQSYFIGQIPAAIDRVNREQRAKNVGQFVMVLWFGSRDRTWGLLDPEEAGLVALTNMMNTPPFI